METRKVVVRGWRATGAILAAQGHLQLAAEIRRFLGQMPPPQTERERIGTGLLATQQYLEVQTMPPRTRRAKSALHERD